MCIEEVQHLFEKEPFPLHEFLMQFCADRSKDKFIVPVLHHSHFYGLIVTKDNASNIVIEYFDPAEKADSKANKATYLHLKIIQLESSIKKSIQTIASVRHAFYDPQLMGIEKIDPLKRAALINRLAQALKSNTLLELNFSQFFDENFHNALQNTLQDKEFNSTPEKILHQHLKSFDTTMIEAFSLQLIDIKVDENGIVQYLVNSSFLKLDRGNPALS